jgi:hypothetical protein
LNGLIRRLVRLPVTLVTLPGATLTRARNLFYEQRIGARLPTAVDNMTPGNPFLEALAAEPVAAGVPYHSIIAVKESFPVIEDGDDGVVKYRSAHVEGAASELVVRSPHSTQANPHTVQEVRRILHLHGEALDEAGLRCGVAPHADPVPHASPYRASAVRGGRLRTRAGGGAGRRGRSDPEASRSAPDSSAR